MQGCIPWNTVSQSYRKQNKTHSLSISGPLSLVSVLEFNMRLLLLGKGHICLGARWAQYLC